MGETKLRSGALNLCMTFRQFEIWKSSGPRGSKSLKNIHDRYSQSLQLERERLGAVTFSRPVTSSYQKYFKSLILIVVLMIFVVLFLTILFLSKV